MFERAARVLTDNDFEASVFQIQMVVYRDYDQLEGVLQYSPWDSNPNNLK